MNQNAAVWLETMVHEVGSSLADPMHRGAWLHWAEPPAWPRGLSARMRCDGVASRVGEVRMEMLGLHLPAPALLWGCACRSSCHVAIPGRRVALREYSTSQSHLPSGTLRDSNSLWNKAWPAHLCGKHLHVQVILSMLFANSKLGAQSPGLFWRR